MAARFVDVSESQVCYFCFIFSNNHQCNFTKTISHLRLCEYRDSPLDFVSVTIRQNLRRLRWLIIKYYLRPFKENRPENLDDFAQPKILWVPEEAQTS